MQKMPQRGQSAAAAGEKRERETERDRDLPAMSV